MKAFKKILAIALVAVMCFALASCTLEDDTDITKDNIKIGVILPGQKDEHDGYVPDLYSTQTIAAINSLTSLGSGISSDRFEYLENIDPTDEDASYDAIHSLINRECKMIFLADPGYRSAIVKYLSADSKDGDVSATDTKVQFILCGGEDVGEKIHAYSADISAAVYLTGVTAGLKAKELNVPKIGFLMKDTGDCSLLNAFALGAQSVYSEVKIEAKAYSDTAADCAALKAAGNVVIASDFYINNIAEGCEDIFFCSFGTDRLSGEYNFLSAPIYDFTQYYINTINAVLDYDNVEYDENGNEIDKSDAKPDIAQNYKGSYKDGAVYLSQFGENAAEGSKTAVDAAEKMILDGTLSLNTSADAPIAGITLAK